MLKFYYRNDMGTKHELYGHYWTSVENESTRVKHSPINLQWYVLAPSWKVSKMLIAVDQIHMILYYVYGKNRMGLKVTVRFQHLVLSNSI